MADALNYYICMEAIFLCMLTIFWCVCVCVCVRARAWGWGGLQHRWHTVLANEKVYKYIYISIVLRTVPATHRKE